MKKRDKLRKAAASALSVFLLLTMLWATVLPAESMALSNASMSFAKKTNSKYTPIAPGSKIVRLKGKKTLYYRKSNGKIRTKKGFVNDLGNTYYVQSGGKIARKKAFRKGGYTFHALSDGKIAKGVHVWKGTFSLATENGAVYETEGIFVVSGNSYYVDKKGVVATSQTVNYKNKLYSAGVLGILTEIPIPNEVGNAVINIARQEVGTATGVKYWLWYFKTKFINTDKTPWCGAFVGWCYYAAGQLDKVSGIKNLGYVPSYSDYADAYGKWIPRASAQAGDIIIFAKNKHVGLVEGISHDDATGEDYIVTIEGNAGITAIVGSGGNGAVVRNAYPINSSKIKGIIRPY